MCVSVSHSARTSIHALTKLTHPTVEIHYVHFPIAELEYKKQQKCEVKRK